MPARTLLQKPAPAPVRPRAAAAARRGPFPAAVPPLSADAGIARAERFGHHYGSLPAAPAAAPIQRSGFWSWLGWGGGQSEQERQAEQRRAAIRRAQEEAAARQQAAADRRSQELHDQEHAAYKRLDEVKTGRQNADERQRLLKQLDGIQRAHSEHIEHVHKNDLELWTPDRDTLAPTDRGRLKTAWNELRHGSGLIKTPTGPGTETINKDLRAMHARLLTGGHGRSLLYQLLEKQGPQTGSTVSILPRDPIQPGERARRREAGKKVDQIEPQIGRVQKEMESIMNDEGLGSMFQAKNHAWKTPANQGRLQGLLAQSQQLSNQLTPLRLEANTRDAAEAGPVTGEHGRHVLTPAGLPGLGASSSVNLMSGIKDSEYVNQDAQGRYIPAPAFIVYGHELIHALHNKRGTDSSGVNQAGYQQKPLAKWSNKAEHDTIDGPVLSENLLRGEHQLTQRGSHFGIAREDLEAQRAGSSGGGRRQGGGRRRR